MDKKLKILIVDDEEPILNESKEILNNLNHIVFLADKPSKALTILNSNDIDIIFLDIILPEINGLDFLKTIKKEFPDIEVIMITSKGDMEKVITAMRYGSMDFLIKPLSYEKIQASIARTIIFAEREKKYKELELHYSLLSEELKRKCGHPLIGKSSAIKNVIELISQVAKSDDTSVLITGESGTGKELVARGIHYLSSRKKNIFYAVNCPAIPKELIESEFFGHVKGAFTNAIENTKGSFEISNNGTLFLDEISEIPVNLQAKLLRVLENKVVQMIGTRKEIYVNNRVIAATNQNIAELIENGKFRIDLYYRLNTFVIHIPSLKERKEDIPLLLDYYIKYFSEKMKKKIIKVDNNIIKTFSNYEFPGNVRELKNLVERAIILCRGSSLTMKHFNIPDQISNITSNILENIIPIDILLKNTILDALDKTNYNQKRAAELLEISENAIARKMKKYNIKRR